jgi:hypothetical protein
MIVLNNVVSMQLALFDIIAKQDLVIATRTYL